MSWKTENSLKRIFNVFKRSKSQIYKEDIEALKYLDTELENAKKSYVNDNLLYAKLLCYVIDRNLHHTDSIKLAIKNTADILKEPLDFHLKMLQKNINDKEFLNYLDLLKISNSNVEQKIKENEKDFLDKLNKKYNFENVSKSFFNTANDFLNETDNYI